MRRLAPPAGRLRDLPPPPSTVHTQVANIKQKPPLPSPSYGRERRQPTSAGTHSGRRGRVHLPCTACVCVGRGKGVEGWRVPGMARTWCGGHGGWNAATLLAATRQRALQVGRSPIDLKLRKQQTAGGAEARQVLAAAAAAWCSGGASEMRVFFGLVFARRSAPLIPPRLVELTVECFAAFRRRG